MGTNYYWIHHECSKCGRHERTHIGKSSGGWTFTFHATDTIRSWGEWQTLLSGSGYVIDECGEPISLSDFKELVASKLDATHNHARLYPSAADYLDADGHSMSEGEFS